MSETLFQVSLSAGPRIPARLTMAVRNLPPHFRPKYVPRYEQLLIKFYRRVRSAGPLILIWRRP